MATKTRNRNTGRKDRLYVLTGMFLIFTLTVLFACSSASDTLTQAKAATSGTYEVLATITAPPDGSTVVFKSDGTTDTTFQAQATGGSGTYDYTWVVKGPTVTNTATGDTPTITFFEAGDHTLTLTVVDSKGITATDSIKLNVVGTPNSTLNTLAAAITSPAITTFEVNDTVAFSGEGIGGSGTMSSYAWTIDGPADTNPTRSTLQSPNIQFLAKGTYTVTFTVKDNQGNVATDTITITIE